jgi:hypothetical protein
MAWWDSPECAPLKQMRLERNTGDIIVVDSGHCDLSRDLPGTTSEARDGDPAAGGQARGVELRAQVRWLAVRRLRL